MNKLKVAFLCASAAVLAVRAEVTVPDTGVQTVMAVQDAPVVEAPVAKTAKEKVAMALDKTFGKNKWKVKTSSRKIALVDVPFEMSNPAQREDFFTVRDLLMKRALLLAKVQIAESISADADAEEEFEASAGEKVDSKFVSGLKLATEDPTAIFGMTVLSQAESWENGVYHIALAVVWSENLKNGAAAFLTNAKPQSGADDAGAADYMADWVTKQSLATICGPRQVITPDGERHFIGIAAREIGSNSEVSQANIRLAQLSAIQSLLFSLYADVTFQDAAKETLELVSAGGVNGMTKGKAIETLERSVSAKAKKVLRGLDEIYSDEVVHPISQRKMYVSVYELSASKAARAKAILTDITTLRAKVAQADVADRAYNQGLQDAVRQAASDSRGAEKARDEAHRAVDAKLNPAKLLPKPVTPTKDPGRGDSRAQEGVFGGDDQIDANIL